MTAVWKEVVKGAISKGTSTGTGSAQTIAHNLGASPNLISVVPTETGAAVTGLYVDSTNIYLTVTDGKDYAWVAMVI